MPTSADHVVWTNRTHATMAVLLADIKAHAPWIATMAFYKALHIAEAVFHARTNGHSRSHRERESILLRDPELDSFAKAYLNLRRASENARYIANGLTFDSAWSPDRIERLLLRGSPATIETEATRLGIVGIAPITDILPQPR